MIKSFANKAAVAIFQERPLRGLSSELCRRALRKMLMIDQAERLEELRVPAGNRLEALHGDRAGQHSIRVNAQWRICFRWVDGDAYDVELVDYH